MLQPVRRLVRLHTYEGEAVLVLGASVSAAMAALKAGWHCLIAAGNDANEQRVAEAIASLEARALLG